MEYEKTQYGILTYVLGILAVITPLLFLIKGKDAEHWQEILLPVILLPLIFLLFYKLTIAVTREYIKVSFGIGIISFKVRPTKIITTEIVHPKWWWGIGIRLTPKGWLYNVASGPAVLISYEKGGMKHSLFVGTAEPEELIRAIQANFQD